MSLMFLDSNPLPKGEVYGYYTCKSCKKKCDALIRISARKWICLNCYYERRKTNERRKTK